MLHILSLCTHTKEQNSYNIFTKQTMPNGENRWALFNIVFGGYSSGMTGLYLGTRAFMMHQPTR